MHALLVPFGSHGDVHPFLGLGQALKTRGHRVTFLINEYFGPLVRGLGFDMIPLGEAHLFEEAMKDPDLWHPRRAFGVVARSILEHTRISLPIIEEIHRTDDVVAVGGSIAMGVRLAQERYGLRAATVHLQPGILHSDHRPPNYAGLQVPQWWPLWLRRAFFNIVFGRVVDPQIAPGLNAQRAELGLPPVKDVLRRWINSPELVLGFFPRWYCAPQPDWPANVHLVGFPLFDEMTATPMPPGLDAFLNVGPPPIAFTPGSANVHGASFFEESADACKRMGRRGLLLTRHPDQIPKDLPEGVIHVDYAPFSLLLPRVAALVHHGGIGTSAQAMSTSTPQLIMPLGHDQFDNASRMKRLGVASSLLPAKYLGPNVAKALERLIKSDEVAQNCRRVAIRFEENPNPMEDACVHIEALARSPRGIKASPVA